MISEQSIQSRIKELQKENVRLDKQYQMYEDEGDTDMLDEFLREVEDNTLEITILGWVLRE